MNNQKLEKIVGDIHFKQFLNICLAIKVKLVNIAKKKELMLKVLSNIIRKIFIFLYFFFSKNKE